MIEEKKEFLDKFIKDSFNYNDFALVVNKLNDFLNKFLYNIAMQIPNIDFKKRLIGEYALQTNHSNINLANVIIEYHYNKEDYEYSLNRSNKGQIKALISDTVNYDKQIIPTIKELTQALFHELSVCLNAENVVIRKNAIGVSFLDYQFCINFVGINNSIKNNTLDFVLKGKKYNFEDFDLLNEKLIEKNNETNGKFFDVIKLFKVVEFESSTYNMVKILASKNLYFYENLLFNIPNKLLNNKYAYDNLVACYNYLANTKPDKLVDPTNNPLIKDYYELFTKYYITTHDLKRVLKQTKLFIENIENILK